MSFLMDIAVKTVLNILFPEIEIQQRKIQEMQQIQIYITEYASMSDIELKYEYQYLENKSDQESKYRLAAIKSILEKKQKGYLNKNKEKEQEIWRKYHKNISDDQYYQFEELLQNNSEKKGMKTLRSHLGDNIIFTGTQTNAINERELEKAELSDGEISGKIFTIGCYTIRSTLCLHKKDNEFDYYHGLPLSPDEIAEYNNSNHLVIGFSSNVREVLVISAKHKNSLHWQEICRITSSLSWWESIGFICTLKYDASALDEQEILFVNKSWCGDSYSSDNWYKLSSDGTVTEYNEHPFNPESYEKSWR